MSLYRSLVRPLLFRLDPEQAHELAIDALDVAQQLPLASRSLRRVFSFEHPALRTTVAHLSFPNPVGLAAGYDKDCILRGILPALGFGFIELGTVTARPQSGNPRPRLFRFPQERAVINRMGFNNEGAEAAARELDRSRKSGVPVGINIGINKDVKPEDSPEAYAKAFSVLYPHADYFAVNVSSPNTEGLRLLQEKLRLERILMRLQELNSGSKPVFVKLAPDLEPDALTELLPLLERFASGVICTNTTLDPALKQSVVGDGPELRGGLSGAPLRELSTGMIRQVYRLTRGRLPIIGVGGIFSAEDAYQKIRAGASLVQVYTGLVYRGPGLAAEVNRGLVRILREQGLGSISEAVGRSHFDIEKPRTAVMT
ncbi:MAG: quinone-dependent dihydroorotate dehydrogenase [Elusimicrobiota bacterium]